MAAALLVPGGGKSDRNSDARLPGGQMLRIGVDRAVSNARSLTGHVLAERLCGGVQVVIRLMLKIPLLPHRTQTDAPSVRLPRHPSCEYRDVG